MVHVCECVSVSLCVCVCVCLCVYVYVFCNVNVIKLITLPISEMCLHKLSPNIYFIAMTRVPIYFSCDMCL